MAVLVALCVVGLAVFFGYLLHKRPNSQPINVKSARESAYSVHLEVTAQKIDPVARRLTLNILPNPLKSLAKNIDERTVFTQETKLNLYPSGPSVIYGKYTAPTLWRVSVPFKPGSESVTEYPWDDYVVDTEWTATVGDQASIPVKLTCANGDLSFEVVDCTASKVGDQDAAGLRLNISRSGITTALALFMIIAMWSLAFGVMAGAIILIRKRDGLVWPALGWMAATLFALVAFRNAAPGSPPIGSLLDYYAFFWAEVFIMLSMVWAVCRGFWDDHKKIALGKANSTPGQCSCIKHRCI